MKNHYLDLCKNLKKGSEKSRCNKQVKHKPMLKPFAAFKLGLEHTLMPRNFLQNLTCILLNGN